jgi:hypothetical protein
MRAGNPIKTQMFSGMLFGYFEEKRGTKRVEREIGRYFNETYPLSALLAGNQVPPHALSQIERLLGASPCGKSMMIWDLIAPANV